jgi:uncharacterized protein YbaR (Trm112 family)
MQYNTLFRVLRLGLRLVEAILTRRAPKRPAPPTRADKVVARVAPLAEKVLDRVAPETAPTAPAGVRRRRRSSSFLFARAAFFGALAASAAAYVVVRQRRRVRDRHRLLNAPFPEELLEVLAAPGGGSRLRASPSGEGLIDPETGRLYPVLDGIPDFGESPASGEEHLAALPASEGGDGLRLMELLDPLKMRVLGANDAGNAALAGAVAAAAGKGWALSAPCGLGGYEIEMARANPQMRLLCLDARWETLLETRRRALEMGMANLYFVRGDLRRLPLQDASIAAVWSAHGFHFYPKPGQAMTQLARAAKPGAWVAGVSLVAGGPPLLDALLRLRAQRVPGWRDEMTHFTLLVGAGLRDLRAVRDGAFVRFTAVRA